MEDVPLPYKVSYVVANDPTEALNKITSTICGAVLSYTVKPVMDTIQLVADEDARLPGALKLYL